MYAGDTSPSFATLRISSQNPFKPSSHRFIDGGTPSQANIGQHILPMLTLKQVATSRIKNAEVAQISTLSRSVMYQIVP